MLAQEDHFQVKTLALKHVETEEDITSWSAMMAILSVAMAALLLVL